MHYIKKYTDIKIYKLVISIAIPMIISNISTPLLGIIDTSIIGYFERLVLFTFNPYIYWLYKINLDWET